MSSRKNSDDLPRVRGAVDVVEAPARQCIAMTKAGPRCRKLVWERLDVCIAHAPKEVQDKAGFGGSQPNAGRKPVKSAAAVLRDMVADHVLLIVKPHLDALGVQGEMQNDGTIRLTPLSHYEERIHVDDQGREVIEYVPRYPVEVRLAAAKDLLDRGLGKPSTTVALTGGDGGPIEVNVGARLTDATSAHAAELARMLAEGDG